MLGKKEFYAFLVIELLLCDIIASQNKCGASYKGELLEDFHGGHSYVSYDLDLQYMKKESLMYEDRFCTKNNGTAVIARLVSTKNCEEIVLETFNGQIGVQLIQNDEVKPECLYNLNRMIYDGSNYKITLQIKGFQLSLLLSRQDIAVSVLTVMNISCCIDGDLSTFTRLERGGMDVDALYLGNAKVRAVQKSHLGKPFLYGNFDGCMGDAIINGIPLAKAAKEDERHDVDPSCHHRFGAACTSACAKSYIPAKGDKCVCPAESEVNDVGLCIRSCSCTTCQNGGSCIAKSGSDAECNCTTGYVGLNCEEKIHPCVDFLCRNGGNCSVQPSGPFCFCPPGFTGIQCEVEIPDDPCQEVSCQNNATCFESNQTAGENFVCYCLDGYEGKLCEIQRSMPSQLPSWAVAVISIAIFAIGFLIGVAFYVAWKRTREGLPDQEQSRRSSSDSKE